MNDAIRCGLLAASSPAGMALGLSVPWSLVTSPRIGLVLYFLLAALFLIEVDWKAATSRRLFERPTPHECPTDAPSKRASMQVPDIDTTLPAMSYRRFFWELAYGLVIGTITGTAIQGFSDRFFSAGRVYVYAVSAFVVLLSLTARWRSLRRQ